MPPDPEGGRRRWGATPALALIGIIAITGLIGIGISRGHQPAPIRSAPTSPHQPVQITADPVPTEPHSGDGFTAAEDVATHQLILFGGVGDYDSTWLWDGTRWTLAHPATSPPGRFGASAAYDPQTRMVMLFGGRVEAGTPVHDTWAWNGSNWLDLDSGAGGPQPGAGSDMAWDPALGEMLLVTGSGVISIPGGTWVWAGTHWRHPAGAILPAGALYSPMEFDPVTQSLIAVGCCQGPPPSGAVDTTWRWIGDRWQLVSAQTTAPIDGSTIALDPASGRLVLCTCLSSAPAEPELTEWDGNDWVALHVSGLPVQGGIEVADVDHARLLLIGAPISAPASNAMPLEVWSLAGSSWRRLD